MGIRFWSASVALGREGGREGGKEGGRERTRQGKERKMDMSISGSGGVMQEEEGRQKVQDGRKRSGTMRERFKVWGNSLCFLRLGHSYWGRGEIC